MVLLLVQRACISDISIVKCQRPKPQRILSNNPGEKVLLVFSPVERISPIEPMERRTKRRNSLSSSSIQTRSKTRRVATYYDFYFPDECWEFVFIASSKGSPASPPLTSRPLVVTSTSFSTKSLLFH